MSEPHRQRAYLRFARIQRARLLSQLPTPCPRCGLPIFAGEAVDLDHIIPVSQYPAGLLDPHNVRLAHRSCNRRHGQGLSAARAKSRRDARRLPDW